MRILIGGHAFVLAALSSGCIVVPVGPPHRHYGYYDGPRGDSVTFHYDDDRRGRGYYRDR